MHTQQFPDEASLIRLVEQFIDCTLPKEQWTNAAHWAAALCLIRSRPEIIAERQLPEMIRRYNLSVGGENTDTSGYHETITQASIRAARAFLASRPREEPMHVSHAELMRSPLGDRNWALAYWSRDILFSVEARKRWHEPDIAPLPY